ncbi:iron complex transport system substrate-binding protein [Antricoccus suffuscus]|uniref:Iron complex transport system substrate-binding protein n=1 Tax=Antricoccus suffuscus TaxID=1629062 RepID=A0A2T0ZYT4_9ACTN|nr:iron-siderophore ABC transporter substrate-binding protein [Antricoccus suffuscus]PRZ41510.1 iron complex transport system substrate-binding protein [Antricoccus suffuscus]
MKHRFAIAAGAAISALALTLTACSSGNADEKSATDQTAQGDASFPVTIDSALGSATIEQKPERVVTIGWGSQDAALALGVVPVGMQDYSSDCGCDDGVLPWDSAALNGKKPTLIKATSKEIPYEQIGSLKPDVILAVNSGLTDEQYKMLSDIAPTVAYPDKPWLTSWQDQIKTVGKALGLTDKASDLETKANKLIDDAAAAHPEFKGKTIAFGSGTEAGNYNFYYEDDSRNELLKQLGFTPSPSIAKQKSSGGESFAKKVSMETLSDVKTDVLVAWYLNDELQSEIEGNQLFKDLTAVSTDSYVPITDPPMVYATSAVTVLSLPWMLDKYLPLLTEAANNAA